MKSSDSTRPLTDPRACQEQAEKMLSFALRAGADGAEVLVRDGASCPSRSAWASRSWSRKPEAVASDCA